MSLLNDVQKLKKLDRLIRYGVTGSPDELAEKMKVSRATIFRLIDRYKEEFGAPVYFDRSINSYCYEYPGKLVLKFQETNISNEDNRSDNK